MKREVLFLYMCTHLRQVVLFPKLFDAFVRLFWQVMRTAFGRADDLIHLLQQIGTQLLGQVIEVAAMYDN